MRQIYYSFKPRLYQPLKTLLLLSFVLVFSQRVSYFLLFKTRLYQPRTETSLKLFFILLKLKQTKLLERFLFWQRTFGGMKRSGVRGCELIPRY